MSNESVKNKLVNSMRMTKAGAATTNTTTEIKEEPAKKVEAPVNKASKPAKKAAAVKSFAHPARVWPD